MQESLRGDLDHADRTGPNGLYSAIDDLVRDELRPLTVRIDREGVYPEAVLRGLGQAGAYRQHLPAVAGGAAAGLPGAIRAMARVSQECLSTGFAVWCQDTCAWYLQNAVNDEVREGWIEPLASGTTLGGTGMSNTMKAFAGIEAMRLKGCRVADGYIVNGSLPWVSNLGRGHVFGTQFSLDGELRSVMALVDCDVEGFSLRQAAHFTALEGTRTYACFFEDVFIPDTMVIDHDGAGFLRRSRAGIVLLQLGMGLGIIQSCIDLCREVEPLLGHVNQYLDDRPDLLHEELDDASEAAMVLAEDPGEADDDYFCEILRLRLAVSELSLRAAQSVMLHTGARGYLDSAPAQRKLREAYFVAIVTPAIKHLRKELAERGQ